MILLLLVAGGAAAQEKPPLSGVLATDGQKAEILRQAQDWQGLELHGAEWSARDGANWESWYYWGLSQSALGQFQKATNSFMTALRLSPKQNDGLLLAIADLQVKIEDWAKAEASYRDILSRQNTNVGIWGKLLAVVRAQPGTDNRTREAEVLETLLTFGEYINVYDYWRSYAELLESLTRLDDAREAYRHVLRLRPTDIEAAEWVYRYERETGNEQELKKIYEHLLKLNSSHALVNIYLAEQALAAGKKLKAQRYFEEASRDQKYPRARAIAFTHLGDLERSRNYKKALNYYLSAINTDASYLPGWEGAVLAYRVAGDSKKARQYFSRLRVVQRMVEEGKQIPANMLIVEN